VATGPEAPYGVRVSGAPFVHHLAISASDFETSERIFTAALAELGVAPLYRAEGVAEYWRESEDRLSLSLERARHTEAVTRKVHVAFAAPDREAVDRFHLAAVAAGAVSRHAPRYWPEYRAYCAFLRDPDGNNIEAVHKEPAAPAV
jgi:catechol 2,3-dioxygenase-like lactoylglutathione lyase family enzyme